MMFLAPLAGLVAGGASLLVLMGLHVLRLRRVPVRVSTIWIWDAASRDTQANVPFQRLRVSWLLLLQVLGIALVAMSIARPAITQARPDAERVVVLIDTSASMGALVEGSSSTRLERTLDMARELIDELFESSTNPEVAILEASASVRVSHPFSSSRRSLRRALSRVAQTDQAGDLRDSIDRAITLTGPSSGAPGARATRFLCFSDAVTSSQALPASGIPDDVLFELVRPQQAGTTPMNVGIVSFRAVRVADDPGRVRCFAQLINTSDQAISVPVVLDINAEARLAREVEIPPSSEESIGRLVFSETIDVDSRAIIGLRLRYADALSSDNAVQGVLGVRHTPRVMIVAPPSGPDEFLVRALESVGAIVVRAVDLAEYESAWASRPDTDAIVFDRVAPASTPLVSSLTFGSSGGHDGVALLPAQPSTLTEFTFWRREHPAMRGVSPESVLLDEPQVLQVDDSIDPGRASLTLARVPDGPAIVALESGSSRHVVVSSSLSSTTWPLEASFIVFVSNTVAWLTPELTPVARSHTTSQTVLVEPQDGTSTIRVSGPMEGEWDAPPSSARASIGPLVLSGIYRVEGASPEWIAVNLESEPESALRSVPLDFATSSDPREAPDISQEARREVWHWFLLAGIAILTIEWFISTSRLRA
ncbi:MAG: BatA domain-containing protein [Phycisphaerales bacterium JB043]